MSIFTLKFNKNKTPMKYEMPLDEDFERSIDAFIQRHMEAL